jgi:hypothetical protein
MDIFISWSGPRSHAVALALHRWLPKIVNAFKPWLSSEIEKGTRWRTDIAGRLQDARAGIICLTPSNLHSDWILFEAGALSKQIENTYVCTLLVELEPTDVKDPLAQFQATKLTKKEIFELLRTLNNSLGELQLSDSHIQEAFDVWWPKLEEDIAKLPQDEAVASTRRSDRELLEEVLGLLREQSRDLASRSPSVTDIISAIARRMVPDIKVSRIGYGSGGYSVTLVAKSGKEYSFSVPGNLPTSQIESAVTYALGTVLAPEIPVPNEPTSSGAS